ncbi:DotI/IcmL/TraM family protein [Fangia hongkongensis]|uniref:DotI/IcmL/TraM family protein n=1 Tax=Fangia hongkongensis TaxID=270495 RepID=UPI00035CD631|nr:DotI/IcmL/TraM family protein [Fangia hongkongensis]MBK2123860.1 DotI/IcmL family type IV secretion protein [Fangia hongkongensis]
MKQDNLKLIMQNASFYRDNFRLLIKVIIISGLFNIFLLLSCWYCYHAKEEKFLAVNDHGVIKQIMLSETPSINNQMVINWVSQNIVQVYALDFLNYRRELSHVEPLFTSDGWSSFNSAFTDTLAQIKSKKIVVSATLSDVPVVTAEGYLSGIRSWKIQVPLLISYSKEDVVQNIQVILQVTVQQQEVTDANQSLFGIAQIIQSSNLTF